MSIFRAFAGTAPAFILAAAGSLISTGVQAQQFMDTGSSQVTVDLGVIEDSGYGPGFASPAFGGRRLLMPGPVIPVSRLLVAPPKGSPSPMKKAVKKAMKEPPQAKAAPPPMPKEPPVPVIKMAVTAPSPPPMPAPVVAKKKAPEPPATAIKEPAEPAAKPAPAAAAPPPPPPLPPETKTVKLAPAPMVSKPDPVPVKALAPGLAMRVKFPEKASKLPADAKDELKGIAAKLKGREDFRLQLLAYAGGDSLSSSKARRLSLSRALSVRSFLIKSGVHSTRIDVRALGNKSSEGPVNRVDVKIADR
jgi:outer membrane protein OmpA-like peptidoglycan-associated protein